MRFQQQLAQQSRCAPDGWRLLLLLVAVGGLAGCRTLSRSGPVSQELTTCRQLTRQGASAIERGDWKRAESLLAKAVQTCPSDVDARRNYAETLRHRGAWNEAATQWEEARRMSGGDPGLTVRCGEMYLSQGRLEAAAKRTDEALAMDPKFAGAWALRGRIATAKGQPRQALADYQRALGYAPDDAEVAILVAETYRALDEPDRALVALQLLADQYARGEAPQQVMYLEGVILTRLGRYDDAASKLLQAARRDPPNAEILCRLAEAELLSGRVANAQTNVRDALALDPNHPGSRALSLRLATATPANGPVTR